MVRLTVKITLDKGGRDETAVISRKSVNLANGSGYIEVAATPKRQTTTIAFEGPYGASMSVEIKQAGFTKPLVKEATTIRHGKRTGFISGDFDLRDSN